MLSNRLRVLSGLALAFLLFLALPLSSARSALQTDEQSATNKIAPWVLERTQNAEEAEFLVVLSARADLRAALTVEDRLERARFTRDTLFELAEATQRPLRNWLEEQQIPHRPFYIVNAIWVKASREVAMAIARRPEVIRLDPNPVINNLPVRDLEKLSDEALRLADELRKVSSIAAIEPGVNFIRAPEVWADGFTGQGIVIAGADTGTQWDHPTLKNHYRGWNGSAANHDYNWHDSIHTGGGVCGPNSPAPCDDNGHGTHTVGTSVGDDGTGNQIGVAPGAKFISCRNMDQGNGKPSTYIECMEFFLAPYPVAGTPAQGDPTKRPDVTINSWTCPSSEGCVADTLKAAVEAQRAAGIMMVVAAGNDGPACSSIGTITQPNPPSHYDAAYTVGAISSTTGLIASFSNRGPVTADASNRIKPDITAPGVSVRSATLNNGFASLSGTSMATPHVAGAIALLWSAEPGLRRQIELSEDLLNRSATPVATTDCSSTGIPNNVYGHGRLNIKAAVDASRPTVQPLSFAVGPVSGNRTTNITALTVVGWTAVSNTSWITVTSGGSGSGNGGTSFSFVANLSIVQRTGTLTVAGRTVSVVQGGATEYSVSGRVVSPTGAGLMGVTLSFARIAGTEPIPPAVVTNPNGNWSQSGFSVSSKYVVMAILNRTVFSPRSREISGPSSSLDFASAPRRVLILGAVAVARPIQ